MPYTPITSQMVEGKRKFCFENKKTGQKICSDTRQGAIAAMRYRYSSDKKK